MAKVKIFKTILTSLFVFVVIQVLAILLFREVINNRLWNLLPTELEAYTVVILTLPLVSIFVFNFSVGDGFIDKLRFLEVKPISSSLAVKLCILTIFFWLSNYFISHIFLKNDEDFMINSKYYVEDTTYAAIIFFSVCIAAPWVEELFFRGWLFKKLLILNIKSSGVVLISTLLFTSMHLQYDNLFTFLSVFCTGLLLSYVRLNSKNTSCSILVHVIFNFMSFTSLLF